MSATTVRIGGIMVFFLIVAVLVLGFALAGQMVRMAGPNTPEANPGANPDAAAFASTFSMAIVLYLAIMIFVYWTTRGLFNAFGYRRADTPIMTLMILMAVNLVLFLVGGAGPAPDGGSGSLGTISAITGLATVMTWIWFAVMAIGFGAHVGSQLWKAIGIVYLVGMILAFAGNGLMMTGTVAAPGLFLLIAGAVVLGGWVCHGIGLIVGSKEMART